MADQLLSVEDMSEIPNKSHSSSGGGSKGANLFLARQKAIADMMEQEEAERAAEANHQQSHGFDHQEAADVGEGATTKVYKPVAFSATSPHNSKQAATDSKRISSEIQHSVSMSASEDVVKKGIKATEIAATNQGTGTSGQKSKGVNLFLQRQKLIADMMEQEEEDARAAEEAKIQEAENKRIQEELRRKQEAERLKLEEEKRRQEEKLLESEKKKAARAAKFKSINPDPEPEPDLPWVKKNTTTKKDDKQRKTLYQLLSADKK